MVTLVANRVRKIASSSAESPPPTTARSLLRKKKPSQVAQVETPRPSSLRSESSPSIFAFAPVEMIRALPEYSSSSTQARKGEPERSTLVASAVVRDVAISPVSLLDEIWGARCAGGAPSRTVSSVPLFHTGPGHQVKGPKVGRTVIEVSSYILVFRGLTVWVAS